MSRILSIVFVVCVATSMAGLATAQEPFTYIYNNPADLLNFGGFDTDGAGALQNNGGLNNGIGLLDYVPSTHLWAAGEQGTIYREPSGNPIPQPGITLMLNNGVVPLENVVIYFFERTTSGITAPEEITATVGGVTRTITSLIGQINDSPSDGSNGFGEIRAAGIDLSGISGDTIELDIFNTEGFPANGEWTGLTEIVVNDPTFVFPVLPLQAVVNRDTGEISLRNINSAPVDLKGYSITSPAGGLTPVNWMSIADNYDMDSQTGTVVDADDNWTNLTNPSSQNSEDLSEYQFGGDGGQIAANSSISLGADAWLQSIFEDVAFEYVDPDSGEIVSGAVLYEGNSDSLFLRSDLDFDGDIDENDWNVYVGGLSMNLSGMSQALAYQAGDLDGDLDNDLRDLRLFKADFDNFQGEGAFAAMIGGSPVSEPSSLALLSIAALGGVYAAHRRRFVRILALIFLLALSTTSVDAQLLGLYRFEDGSAGTTLNVGGALLDSTGRENDASVFTGTIDLVTGKSGFGNAAQFTNGLASAFLAEAGGTVDDFAVAFWMKATPSPGAANAYYMAARDAGAGNQVSAIYDFEDEDVELFGIGGPDPRPGSQLNIADSDWHHIVYTRTGNDYDAYLDGVKTDVATLAGSFTGIPETFGIGGSVFQGGSNNFDGLLDDVAWFNEGLDQSQVNAMMAGDFSEFIALLDLVVNTTTGSVSLKNNTPTSITFDGYLVNSSLESLDVNGWNSLDDQNLDAVGSGDGESWDEGGGSSTGEVSEGYLLSSSTIAPNGSLSLGNLYNEAVDTRDLVFRFSTVEGVFRGGVTYVEGQLMGDYNGDGAVDAADYTAWRDSLGANVTPGSGADGNGNGTVDPPDYQVWGDNFGASSGAALDAGDSPLAGAAVPEPTSIVLVLLAAAALLGRCSRSTNAIRGTVLIAAAALTVLPSVSLAAFGLDRNYLFGDDAGEGAFAGNVIGSGADGFTFDSEGTPSAGDFQDLERVDVSSNNPLYLSVSDRPGAGSTLGAVFDGNGDFLLGDRLGLPSTSEPAVPGDDNLSPLDYAGIANRGFQFWAKPNSAWQGTNQALVLDTNQHGVLISENNTWVMRYGGIDTDTGMAVDFDDWAHIMLVRPSGAANGDRMYIDGVAVAAQATGYDGADEAPLVLGANTGDTDLGQTAPGTEDFYAGVLDDLTMFVFGTSTGGTAYGEFDFATDNAFAADAMTGVAGDVDQNGLLQPADIAAFVDGWLYDNLVNGVRVPDLNSLSKGDLNFDGITNLLDAIILDNALQVSGLSGMLAFDGAGNPYLIPEPPAWGSAISVVLVFAGGWYHARRRRSLACRVQA